MSRLLAAVLVAAMAGVAVADIPPPPPPKGKKYVNVSNEVKLGKDVSGYVFVQSRQGFAGPGMLVSDFSKVELSATKSTAMPSGGRRISVSLFAVPQDAAKAFKTDADLFDALKAQKVKGAHALAFNDTTAVSTQVKGDSVKWTYSITAIDDKGIKRTVEGEGYEPPPAPKKGAGKEPPKEDDSPDVPPELYRCGTEPDLGSQLTARGGSVVAGAAAGVALTLGGLWVVGRGRRKV